jgi:hypothetical protein
MICLVHHYECPEDVTSSGGVTGWSGCDRNAIDLEALGIGNGGDCHVLVKTGMNDTGIVASDRVGVGSTVEVVKLQVGNSSSVNWLLRIGREAAALTPKPKVNRCEYWLIVRAPSSASIAQDGRWHASPRVLDEHLAKSQGCPEVRMPGQLCPAG